MSKTGGVNLRVKGVNFGSRLPLRRGQYSTPIHTRFSPVIDPRFSYRGENVVTTLDRVCKSIGYPATIRVDQGSEFVSRDLDLWAYQNDVTLDFSRPGKPTDNAFIEKLQRPPQSGVPEHALVPDA